MNDNDLQLSIETALSRGVTMADIIASINALNPYYPGDADTLPAGVPQVDARFADHDGNHACGHFPEAGSSFDECQTCERLAGAEDARDEARGEARARAPAPKSSAPSCGTWGS